MAEEPTGRDRDSETDEALDEIELQRTPPVPGQRPPGAGPAGTASGLLPYVLAGAAVLGAGVLAVLFLVFRTPAGPRPSASATVAPPVAAGSPAAPEASPAAPLPRLDDSDPLARRLGEALSARPELVRWLARPGLLRLVAVVVTNVADGESPRPHLEFLAPSRRFAARPDRRGRLVADPAGFAGYDTLGDVMASVEAGAVVAAYRTVEPLLDEAHRELGHPEGRFRTSLDKAIAVLLAVPVPPDDAALERHATLLRWADPALESLTPAQKHLLRMGPRNVRLVQAKLRDIQAALSAPPSP
jgi:hypothetical protein